MIVFIFFVIFLIGLAIGSFINALEYRTGTKLSIVKGRSICPKCKKQLAWYDNIPVLSFLFLNGKCRQCKEPISWQYPVVELITGVAFVALATRIFNFQFSIFNQITRLNVINLLTLFFIFSILILVALHDQKTTYVLSSYIYAAIAFTFIYLMISYIGAWEISELWLYLRPNILSSIVAMLPFALLYVVSKGAWMGAGDIEVAALLGFLLGWPNFLVALYFAFFVGSIWGLIKVYGIKSAALKSEVPFAPFLIAGILFAFLFGGQIISLYVNIFLG